MTFSFQTRLATDQKIVHKQLTAFQRKNRQHLLSLNFPFLQFLMQL